MAMNGSWNVCDIDVMVGLLMTFMMKIELTINTYMKGIPTQKDIGLHELLWV